MTRAWGFDTGVGIEHAVAGCMGTQAGATSAAVGGWRDGASGQHGEGEGQTEAGVRAVGECRAQLLVPCLKALDDVPRPTLRRRGPSPAPPACRARASGFRQRLQPWQPAWRSSTAAGSATRAPWSMPPRPESARPAARCGRAPAMLATSGSSSSGSKQAVQRQPRGQRRRSLPLPLAKQAAGGPLRHGRR